MPRPHQLIFSETSCGPWYYTMYDYRHHIEEKGFAQLLINGTLAELYTDIFCG